MRTSAVFLISTIFHGLALTEALKVCHGKIHECGDNMTCVQVATSDGLFTGNCQCVSNFTMTESGTCVPKSTAPPPSTEDQSSFSGSWIFIPVPVVGILLLLGFLIKRYFHTVTDHLYALRVRRYNTVFVSSTANVDDDAPIT